MMTSVTFLHLDLGIGGAEKLVVDAAVALKERGHDVRIITTHHDPSHCFEETKDSTLPVTVVGDFLPRQFLGKFSAVFSYVRMIYAALYFSIFSGIKSDIVFCDQVSCCIPFLFGVKRVFYCHFPDQLLSQRGGLLKRFYRFVINRMEEITTNMADIILVNSEFTKCVFKETFASIEKIPQVLYPSVNTKILNKFANDGPSYEKFREKYDIADDCVVFLSINRYERKKNVSLAIEAFHLLKIRTNSDFNVKLIIAGGYDPFVLENEEYYVELKHLVSDYRLENEILFLKSPTDVEKVELLKYTRAVIYTPSNEHFGIVPLEAMYFAKPVVAVNSGGPEETIIDSVTGFLCASDSEEFCEAMYKYCDENVAKSMGAAARERFNQHFSYESFGDKLFTIISK